MFASSQCVRSSEQVPELRRDPEVDLRNAQRGRAARGGGLSGRRRGDSNTGRRFACDLSLALCCDLSDYCTER